MEKKLANLTDKKALVPEALSMYNYYKDETKLDYGGWGYGGARVGRGLTVGEMEGFIRDDKTRLSESLRLNGW